MSQVDFVDASTTGLESSPVAEALAWVEEILRCEHVIEFASRPLDVAVSDVEGIHWVHVFYESGLAVNVLYPVADKGQRAVGFKLSEGMEVPDELSAFKLTRQKSKLAGTIRGSFFVIKGEHPFTSPDGGQSLPRR